MRIKVRDGVQMKMDEGDSITFEKWMEQVDGLVMRHAGVGVDDLPDCPFYDWYTARLRPIRAANTVLARATGDLIYE